MQVSIKMLVRYPSWSMYSLREPDSGPPKVRKGTHELKLCTVLIYREGDPEYSHFTRFKVSLEILNLLPDMHLLSHHVYSHYSLSSFMTSIVGRELRLVENGSIRHKIRWERRLTRLKHRWKIYRTYFVVKIMDAVYLVWKQTKFEMMTTEDI